MKSVTSLGKAKVMLEDRFQVFTDACFFVILLVLPKQIFKIFL
jgi:hypothetical protein